MAQAQKSFCTANAVKCAVPKLQLRAAGSGAALPSRRQPFNIPAASGRRNVVRAAYISPAQQAPPGGAQRLDLQLETSDFQQAVQLTALRRKKGGTAILIQEVDPASASYAAGVRSGQQLLALSDPVRQSELWELNGLASLKYCKQAIDGRAGVNINVRLTGEILPEWRQAAAAARAALGSSSSDEDELTADERTELLSQLKGMHEVATQRRQASRDEKLETRKALALDNLEKNRSSTPYFVAFVALFILVPLGVVLVALGTGYIDKLGPR